MMKLEKSIEQDFKNAIKNVGGLAWKFVSPSQVGVPDRVVLYKGRAYFVELKRPKGILSPVQKLVFSIMKRHGFDVSVVRNQKDIEDFVERLKNGI